MDGRIASPRQHIPKIPPLQVGRGRYVRTSTEASRHVSILIFLLFAYLNIGWCMYVYLLCQNYKIAKQEQSLKIAKIQTK